MSSAFFAKMASFEAAAGVAMCGLVVMSVAGLGVLACFFLSLIRYRRRSTKPTKPTKDDNPSSS